MTSNKNKFFSIFCDKIMALGFKNAFFSGLTTLKLSKIIHRFIIKEKKLKEGIYNISGPKIDKYSLLNIIKKDKKPFLNLPF